MLISLVDIHSVGVQRTFTTVEKCFMQKIEQTTSWIHFAMDVASDNNSSLSAFYHCELVV